MSLNDFLDSFNGEKLVLVDFYSSNCVPCRQMEPILSKLINKIKIIKVNVEDNPLISSKYFVRGLPTLLFFKNGNPYSQMVGFSTLEQIEKKIKELNN